MNVNETREKNPNSLRDIGGHDALPGFGCFIVGFSFLDI